MGVYLVSVGALEWFGAEEDGFGELASALDAELVRRGRPPYRSVPEEAEYVPGSGLRFEEKLVPSMDGFAALCEQWLTEEEAETLCGWTTLVPFSLDEEMRLEVPSGYTESTLVVGAPQVLALAERLADVLKLPVDEIPRTSDSLELTCWFRQDGEAPEVSARRPGPWGRDLDTSFYVALFLRAAQHSIRRDCPIILT